MVLSAPVSQLKASLSGEGSASPLPDSRKLHITPSISNGNYCIHALGYTVSCGLTIEVNMGNASPSLRLWPTHMRVIPARASWLSRCLAQWIGRN